MSKLSRVRKAVVTAVGMAVTLVLFVPDELIPEPVRPYVGIVLALGTIFGVYKARNDQPATAPTRAALPSERPPRWLKNP